MFNSEEHQKWIWQPCERFLPRATRQLCAHVCKARLAAGQECDYGGIRLKASPRNVLRAEVRNEGGDTYRAPGIVDFEQLPRGTDSMNPEDMWHDYWQHR